MLLDIILLIYSILSLNSNENIKASKITSSVIIVKQSEEKILKSTIEFIKIKEGFSSYVYNDRGYKAIGYGQRLACFDGVITEPMDTIKADSILRISFDQHRKMVKRVYPKLNYYQNLAISHLSYCYGIGKIKQNGIMQNGKLNESKLLSISNKDRRQYELKLYNHE